MGNLCGCPPSKPENSTTPPDATAEKCESSSLSKSSSKDVASPRIQVFTYGELAQATSNFHPDNILGSGGFGYVFKGWINLQDSTEDKPEYRSPIAVKKLRIEGLQGHKEWLSEVNHLSQLVHPNLIKLLGYCLEGDNRLLVYEYVVNCCVAEHLFGQRGKPLSWAQRMKIAIGSARVLSFLHERENPVIYRDFKTTNLLIDENYDAKLIDLGYAKFGSIEGEPHFSSQVMGTEGYAAPEYIETGRVTTRCDVYSYGVVLVELLSGRPAIDKTKIGGEENLVEWATPYLTSKCKVLRIMDIALEGKYPKQGAYMVAALALECLGEAKLRPSMKDIVARLEKIPIPKDDASPWKSNKQLPSNRGLTSSLGQIRHMQRGMIFHESAISVMY